MHLGLTSLFSFVSSRPRSSTRAIRHPRSRRLFGERLETRYALAGDLIIPELPIPEDGQTLTPPADIVPPPVDPGMGDPGAGDPGSANVAPVITEFTFSTEGNWITIQGVVSDDQNSVGYLVEISGLLSLSLSVNADNIFSYRFEATPEYSGSIFAQTRDIFGLLSNIMEITI